MRTHQTARRILLVPALGLAGTAVVTGCASGSASSLTATAPATEAAAGSAAITAIKANWVKFFDGTTPVAKRIAVLENGAKYETLLSEELGTTTAPQAGAIVQSVALAAAHGANVEYTLTINGQPVLYDQKGTAVYQDGVWKVSVTSFCALAALENNGKSAAGCPAS